LKAEISYAVTHEGALSVSDIVNRRTRLNFELSDQGTSLLEEISEIAARALGWDSAKKEESIREYREAVSRQESALVN
jgi:glycerol-3-phosphate dehydrogenase